MANAAFTYDITVEHVQITTDLMAEVRSREDGEPARRAADWVKLDLLAEGESRAGSEVSAAAGQAARAGRCSSRSPSLAVWEAVSRARESSIRSSSRRRRRSPSAGGAISGRSRLTTRRRGAACRGSSPASCRHDALASLYRVFVGFVIGGGLALPLGLLMGVAAAVYRLLNPLVQILRPIPPIAYIPLAILWFGLGNPPAFFLICAGRLLPGPDEHHRRGAERRRHLPPGRAEPGRRRADALPPRHPPGRHALHPDRRPRRHRRGLHRRHRGRDDRGEQRARLPDPRGAGVLLVRQDHRRDDHHRPHAASASTRP